MPHSGQTGVTFTSGGQRLLGTLFLAANDTPKPTVVLLHGIPGIEKNYDLAHALRKHGLNALIFHYRGCWGSGGDYTFTTIPADVQAALDYLSSGTHLQVDPSRLALAGHSLGGWAAILTAARDDRVRGVLNIAGVNDIRAFDITPALAAADFAPWLPGSTPDDLSAQWSALTDDFNPLAQVAAIAPRPVWIVAAGEDTVLPPARHAQPLYAAAHDPKHYHLHPEANHSFVWQRPWLIQRLLDWVQAVFPTGE